MALAETGFVLNGIGLNGYWPKWELDQVALDEMALDEMGLDEVAIDLHNKYFIIMKVPAGSVTDKAFHDKGCLRWLYERSFRYI